MESRKHYNVEEQSMVIPCAYLNAVLPKLPDWPASKVSDLSPLLWRPS